MRRTLPLILCAVLLGAALAGAGGSTSLAADYGEQYRCLQAALERVDAFPEGPATSKLQPDVDAFVNAEVIESDRFAVHKAPDLAVKDAFNMYAAFDPATHRLLVLQRVVGWSYIAFYSLDRIGCALPQTSLAGVRTKAGLTIGSSESEVVSRLGPGNPVRGNGFSGRYYDNACTGIMFAIRKGRVVDIDTDPGAGC
jgi:hypothetical protein